ncbi:MAG: AMP-binding protein [Planctomycetota bacterium]
MTNTGDLFEGWTRDWTGKQFILGEESLSYEDFGVRVNQLTNWMVSSGLRPNNVFAICIKNQSAVAVAVCASLRAGAIFCVLDPACTDERFWQSIRLIKPKMILLDSSSIRFGSEMPSNICLLSVGVGNSTQAGVTLAEVFQLKVAPAPIVARAGVDCAGLLLTSGSTSEPKAVMITHDNLRFSIEAIHRRLRYVDSDTIGIFLPLAFDYSLYQLFIGMRARASIFLAGPDQVGPRFVSILQKYSISVLPGVPVLLKSLLTLLGRRPGYTSALKKLRLITNTGDYLSPTAVSQLHALLPGVSVCLMYGLTECKRVSILLPSEFSTRPNSVGRPLDDTQAFVVGKDNQRLPPNQTGEIIVSGPHVSPGYWQDPDETRDRFGWDKHAKIRYLRTGDYGWIDEEGYIYFIARKGTLLKHRGYRISAAEIEEATCNIEGILDAGVAQAPKNDRIYLFVVTAHGNLATDRLLEKLSTILEPWKVPHEVRKVKSIPQTPRGKCDRNRLEDWAIRSSMSSTRPPRSG